MDYVCCLYLISGEDAVSTLSLIHISSGEFIPTEKRERVTAKITSILFPQSCSSPSALQYFQNSILRLIPCSILNCGIRRMKLICFQTRTWTEISLSLIHIYRPACGTGWRYSRPEIYGRSCVYVGFRR